MPISHLSVDDLVSRLELTPHPEGGFYSETYRASETIPKSALPGRFAGDRAFATAIYFLLPRGEVSSLHRIASDEVWHFYAGGPLTVHVLDEATGHRKIVLGRDLVRGETPQAVVQAGAWFGARIEGDGDFALVGCTVAPGFDFADFELGTRARLAAAFPDHAALVRALTKA